MTPQEIGERLTQITAALVEKTGEQPFIEPASRVGPGGECSITLYRSYRPGASCVGVAMGGTFVEALAEADRIIAALPDQVEVAA